MPLPGSANHGTVRAAFTLIELLVVVVILTIVASLSLAGLISTRQRAKADKTRSTIRKIDAVIRPMYDSYRTRRISSSVVAKRGVIAREMPESWDEVPDSLSALNALSYPTNTIRTYTNYRLAASGLTTANYSSHECLYLIVARSGFEPDALENFRTDEIIDTDGDQAKEFSDGWGNPIAFMRWAPGFSSPLQSNDPTNAHDPLDPLRTDSTAFALIPLVYSPGPDETYGLITMSGTTGSGTTSGWASLNLSSICSLTVTGAADPSWNGKLAGTDDPSKPTASADNMSNHDLTRK